MREKKIVAVILEGPSDETALGSILKEHFRSQEVQFVVVHGDITSVLYANPDNIDECIIELIDRERKKYGYKWTDFQQIIHIADTDGVFTTDKITQADVPKIMYYEDHIESADVEVVQRRNTRKAENLIRLATMTTIKKIKYRIYFNSCNLEHVLYKQLSDFTDEQKADMAYDFADEYEGKLDEFIAFISGDDVAVAGNYRRTWQYIRQECHSLERHSNMHLIFE